MRRGDGRLDLAQALRHIGGMKGGIKELILPVGSDVEPPSDAAQRAGTTSAPDAKFAEQFREAVHAVGRAKELLDFACSFNPLRDYEQLAAAREALTIYRSMLALMDEARAMQLREGQIIRAGDFPGVGEIKRSRLRKAIAQAEWRAGVGQRDANFAQIWAERNEQLDREAAVARRIAEYESPGYTGDTPSSETAETSPLLRMPEDDLNTKVKKAKAENLARVTPRPATLQTATYRALLQNVDLLNPDLAEDERKRRAHRLVAAYKRVRNRRPQFRDHNRQLRAAFSIVNKAQYQRDKLKREAALRLAPG